MVANLAEVREEWRNFRHDAPGERFRNHRERMQRRSRKHMAVATALGVLLLAAGVVLLFMPGPGLLLIVFGAALVSSHSKRISDAMDRAEPVVRERGRQLAHWWHRRSRFEKVTVIIAGALIATLALAAMWKWVVAAHLL